MNYKGWIRESKTLELTQENVKSVKGDVYIRKGAALADGSMLESEVRGRIIEIKNDYTSISLAGGAIIHVQQQDIIYPEVNTLEANLNDCFNE
jgi:hypothetical protein